MAVHTVWNTLNACKYRYTCNCRADSSQHRVSCTWNSYQPSHSIYLAQTDRQTDRQTDKENMNCVLVLHFHLIQKNKVWQLSSKNISAQAAIPTHHTSNQHHEAVLPEILRFVQIEREPLPIMEPKVSKHPSNSSCHKPHNSNPKDQISSKYPAVKPVTKYNLQKVTTDCPSPYHKGIHGQYHIYHIIYFRRSVQD